MARLPELKRLKIEDVPDAPDWVEPVFSTINRFMESIYTSYNKNLTLEENIQSQLETITFYGNDFANTIKIRNKLKKIPSVVILGMLMTTGDGSHVTITDPTTIDWGYDGTNVIIYNITNTDLTTQYKANILIL